MGDKLYFYYSGWNGDHGIKDRRASGGQAILTRDRYLSLSPQNAASPGRLTTPLLKMAGGRLWINAGASSGDLRVGLLTAKGEPVPGYGVSDCKPIVGDSLEHRVSWRAHRQLPANGKHRIAFVLSGKARLYGFGSRK